MWKGLKSTSQKLGSKLILYIKRLNLIRKTITFFNFHIKFSFGNRFWDMLSGNFLHYKYSISNLAYILYTNYIINIFHMEEVFLHFNQILIINIWFTNSIIFQQETQVSLYKKQQNGRASQKNLEIIAWIFHKNML